MSVGFADLVASVQVGTRKAPPPRATELPLVGVDRTTLLELGTLGLMRRAGVAGMAATPLPPAPPETARISDKAAGPLKEALDGSFPAVLEWAEEAARRGFVVPPSVLPSLLTRVAKHPVLRPVLGERGRWLAPIMEIDLPEPTAAEEVALETFETLEPRERAETLAALSAIPGNLPHFRKGLTDGRKEVREAAAEKLLRLFDAPETQELRHLAQEAVTVRRSLLRTGFEVALPTDGLPKWLPRTSSRAGMGPGALALFDLLRFVPPSLWEHSPSELLAWAEKTDHKAALIQGWGEAATRFEETSWIDALLAHTRQSIYAVGASEAAFDAFLIALAQDSKGIDLVYAFANAREAPLSQRVSTLVVETASKGRGHVYAVSDLGYRLHLSVIPLLQEPWPEGGPFESIRERWRSTLDLRRRLLDSLL